LVLRLSLLGLRTAGTPRHLPSSPTRRSSDLAVADGVARVVLLHRDQHAVGRRLDGLHVRQRRERAEHHALDLVRRMAVVHVEVQDRKSTRLNSSHQIISYAVFCLKNKNMKTT